VDYYSSEVSLLNLTRARNAGVYIPLRTMMHAVPLHNDPSTLLLAHRIDVAYLRDVCVNSTRPTTSYFFARAVREEPDVVCVLRNAHV
jgi:hypothetical protein